jgi:hypothetical protein
VRCECLFFYVDFGATTGSVVIEIKRWFWTRHICLSGESPTPSERHSATSAELVLGVGRKLLSTVGAEPPRVPPRLLQTVTIERGEETRKGPIPGWRGVFITTGPIIKLCAGGGGGQ